MSGPAADTDGLAAGSADASLRAALDALRSGDNDAAIAVLDRLLDEAQAPSLARVLRARAARQSNDVGGAEALLADARVSLSEHPQLLAEMGYVALARGNSAAAVRHFEQLSDALPGHADTHVNLALAYRARGRHAAARVSLEKALALEVDAPAQVCAELARLLMLMRRFDEAERRIAQALELDPTCAHALTAQASMLAGRGEFDAAIAACEAALATDDGHVDAWRLLATVQPASSVDDTQVQRLQARLAQTDAPSLLQETLHFALGKAMDDCGAYAAAFEHYAEANRLAGQHLSPYDAAHQEAITDALIDTCNEDFLRRVAVDDTAGDRPIFVVGLPRSGATLIELALASHSAVTMGGELPYFDKAARMRLAPWPQALNRLEPGLAQALASDYLDVLRAIDADARVTNRHAHSALHLGLIAALLPDATLIHCERDPLDTCLSMYFAAPPAAQMPAHSLDDIAHFVAQNRRLMAHWRALLGDRLLRIRYEDFVIDPDVGVEALLNHADLPFEAACVTPQHAGEIVTAASMWQVRQPIHIESCERWRHYASHLESAAQRLGVPLD